MLALLGVAASSPFWRNTMLTKKRILISAEEYMALLQSKKVVTRVVHPKMVLTTFDDESYIANIEGCSFVYRPF